MCLRPRFAAAAAGAALAAFGANCQAVIGLGDFEFASDGGGDTSTATSTTSTSSGEVPIVDTPSSLVRVRDPDDVATRGNQLLAVVAPMSFRGRPAVAITGTIQGRALVGKSELNAGMNGRPGLVAVLDADENVVASHIFFSDKGASVASAFPVGDAIVLALSTNSQLALPDVIEPVEGDSFVVEFVDSAKPATLEPTILARIEGPSWQQARFLALLDAGDAGARFASGLAFGGDTTFSGAAPLVIPATPCPLKGANAAACFDGAVVVHDRTSPRAVAEMRGGGAQAVNDAVVVGEALVVSGFTGSLGVAGNEAMLAGKLVPGNMVGFLARVPLATLEPQGAVADLEASITHVLSGPATVSVSGITPMGDDLLISGIFVGSAALEHRATGTTTELVPVTGGVDAFVALLDATGAVKARATFAIGMVDNAFAALFSRTRVHADARGGCLNAVLSPDTASTRSLLACFGPDLAPQWSRPFAGSGQVGTFGSAFGPDGFVVAGSLYQATADFGGGQTLTSAEDYDGFLVTYPR